MLRTLVLFACSILSSAEHRAKPEDPLEALVEKTNALEGFTAHYRITDRDGVEVRMTLCYAAPDRAAMTVESGHGVQHMWVIDGEMCITTAGESGKVDFGRVEVQGMLEQQHRISELLRAEFPGAPAENPDPLGPGIFFMWEWKDTKSNEKASANVGPNYALSRSHVCGWLENLQHAPEAPSETENELVWVLQGDYKVEISKSTGFIKHAQRLDPKSKSEVLLEKLELEAPSDSAVFAAPKSPPEGARDVSRDMERGMRMPSLAQSRERVWTLLAKWIDAKSVTWDARSPEKLTRVLRPVCAGMVEGALGQTLERTRQWIDSTSEALAARVSALARDDDEGLTRLKTERDQALTDMEGQMKARMSEFSDRAKPPAAFPKDSNMSAAFLECERAAIRAEFQLQVVDPMLALFRERTDAALTR